MIISFFVLRPVVFALEGVAAASAQSGDDLQPIFISDDYQRNLWDVFTAGDGSILVTEVSDTASIRTRGSNSLRIDVGAGKNGILVMELSLLTGIDVSSEDFFKFDLYLDGKATLLVGLFSFYTPRVGWALEVSELGWTHITLDLHKPQVVVKYEYKEILRNIRRIQINITDLQPGPVFIDNFRFDVRSARGIARSTPYALHVSTETDPSSELTFMWITSMWTPSVVEYGLGQLQSLALGESWFVAGIRGVVHKVRVSGLTSDSDYVYMVGSHDTGWSDLRRIKTAPILGRDAQFTFTIFGDQGANDISQGIIRNVKERRPALHLLVGDTCHANGNSTIWLRWLNMTDPLSSETVYMPVIGNHEYEPGGFGKNKPVVFCSIFALPGNGRWYSFNWGNTHFLTLDLGPNADYTSPIPDEEIEWLLDDLKRVEHDERIVWRIVLVHFPLYVYEGGLHGSDVVHRKVLEPIFQKYKVDMVFSGHEHVYSRSYPVYESRVYPGATDVGEVRSILQRYEGNVTSLLANWLTGLDTKDVFLNPEAPLYVVTGGGGQGSGNKPTSIPPWVARWVNYYHYPVVQVLGDTIYITVYDRFGVIVDRFLIWKPSVSATKTTIVSSTSVAPPLGIPGFTIEAVLLGVIVGLFVLSFGQFRRRRSKPRVASRPNKMWG